MQQQLILVLALVSCSVAAPIEKSKPVDLVRPSPINPDILSDPKPDEKITLITDPKVLPLVTTEVPTKLPGPYILPRDSLLRAKRGDLENSKSDENSSKEEKKSSLPLDLPPTSSVEKQTTKPSTASSAPSSSSTSTTITSRPRIPYSPLIHPHNEHLFKPSATTSTKLASSQDHVNDKRDIPVPLTRKFHQNDDDDRSKQKEEPSLSSTSPSTKVPIEEAKQEEKKPEGHKAELVASTSTTASADQHSAVTIARPIPVAELFAKKPSTQ